MLRFTPVLLRFFVKCISADFVLSSEKLIHITIRCSTFVRNTNISNLTNLLLKIIHKIIAQETNFNLVVSSFRLRSCWRFLGYLFFRIEHAIPNLSGSTSQFGRLRSSIYRFDIRRLNFHDHILTTIENWHRGCCSHCSRRLCSRVYKSGRLAAYFLEILMRLWFD